MVKGQNLLFEHLQVKHPYAGRKSRGVYDLDVVPREVGNNQRMGLSSLTNLSLLKAKETDSDEESQAAEEPTEVEERPVTPINESIQSAPKSFSALRRHVRRRINPRPYWNHISIEDQRSLGAVLLGEVNAVWSSFRKQVDDPFLTQRQNKELQRRIAVHIVTVCEQLFLYFCNQVKVLNARGVFSEAANMSRIRGQIALSADKYLNILAVRRHIIADLRSNKEHDSMKQAKTKDSVTLVSPKALQHLSFHNLIETSKSKTHAHSFNITQELRDLRRQMPNLDMSAPLSMMPSRPLFHLVDDQPAAELQVLAPPQATKSSPEPVLPIRVLKKWSSEPLLPTVSSMLSTEDTDITLENESPSISRLSPVKNASSASLLFHSAREPLSAPQSALKCKRAIAKTPSMAITDPQKDLINLIESQTQVESEDDSLEEGQGIPPLIQAITRRQIQDQKVKKLKQEGKELDERKRLFEEEERRPLPAPKYPQPPVVQAEIPGYANPVNRRKVTIRSSDVHIPDKVELPPISLDIHGPLYNDLIGEISPATVKELDANLFQGEELNEVYSEVMKTVPDEHLRYDNDPLVVKPAPRVDINSVLASSTLSRPRSQQIINPELKKARTMPPWAGKDHDIWERNNRPSQSAGRSVTGSNLMTTHHPHVDLHKGIRPSRAFASWLAWWKATINTDDYFKFLSTKETDFLGVIYHFYDSEAGDARSESSARTAQLEAERRRERLLDEIKAKKERYVSGLWNVNAVTLGGLGKYPDLDEYEVALEEAEREMNEQSDEELPVAEMQSDENADSESSFQREVSPRRKSVSPKRRVRSTLQSLPPLDTSDEDSDLVLPERIKALRNLGSDSSIETAVTATSETASLESSSMDFKVPVVVHDSYTTKLIEHVKLEKEKQHSKNEEGKIPALDYKVKKETVSTADEDSQLPVKDSGLSVLMRRKAMELKDSDLGSTGVETDASYVSRSEPSRGITVCDENTSGYLSLDSHEPPKPERAVKRKLSSRRATVRTEGSHAASSVPEGRDSVDFERHWRPSAAHSVKRPINLLKGYYKAMTSSKAPSSGVSPAEKVSQTVSEHQVAVNSMQNRFEAVWRRLKMTSGQKLTAALKYSGDRYINILGEVVSSWESVTDLIQKREKLLHDLENFEREASDPHRFFYKGSKGSSTTRLHEAKTRAKLYQKLEGLERLIAPMLHAVHVNYNDIVTFEGRPYHEKMNMDKIEMLYWLQQERRCKQLERRGQTEQWKQFVRDNHVTTQAPVVAQPLPMAISNVTIN